MTKGYFVSRNDKKPARIKDMLKPDTHNQTLSRGVSSIEEQEIKIQYPEQYINNTGKRL